MQQTTDRWHGRQCEIATQLTDGRAVCLRTIRPSDEAWIRQGISELSDRSRYLRFFSAFREPPDSIVKQLSAVDGHEHIGWGAILLDGVDNPPIAAAHVIRADDGATVGELAVAVLDEYQGLGVARMLIAAAMHDCAIESLLTIEMQLLGENNAAVKLVLQLGAERKSAVETVQHYTLDVCKALERLRTTEQPPGVKDVIASFASRRHLTANNGCGRQSVSF
jgi:GNAT superfamily N-acetyltransferase